MIGNVIKPVKRIFALSILIILLITIQASPTLADRIDSGGSVYIVFAIDTEPGRPDPWIYEQSLNLSGFEKDNEDSQISKVMDREWRHQYRDSFGNLPRFTWFIMSHELFRHAVNGGGTRVYDALMRYEGSLNNFGDEIAWHYHHADWTDFDGDGKWAWNQLTSFDGSEYTHGTDIEIAERALNSLLVERNFFPTAFRSGWVWENNDFSRWLERIIPFDFSAYPPNKNKSAVREPIRNQYDWSEAPRDYSGYHPSHKNYQKPGGMRRWIFRSIAPNNRREWASIFRAAANDGDQVLCYTGHSYDKLMEDIDSFLPPLLSMGDSLGIRLVFTSASEAGAAIAGQATTEPLELDMHRNGESLIVSANIETFQKTPYCVLTDSAGSYQRVYPISDENKLWRVDISNLRNFKITCTVCNRAGSQVAIDSYE